MEVRLGNFWQLCGAIALGFAIGVSVSFGAQPAVAAGSEAASSIAALSEQVARNSNRIAELERQLRAVDGRIGTIDRRVESNRDATKNLATRSGIQIDFRD